MTSVTSLLAAVVYASIRDEDLMETIHIYRVQAKSTELRSGEVASPNVPGSIEFSAPTEFLGKSGVWTPEDFFVAAVVTCFVSTFSSIANLSNFNFVSLDVEAEGRLERVEGAWRFVRITLHPDLRIPREADRERAIRLLEKAGKGCLIARSMSAPTVLEPNVIIDSRHAVTAPAA